MCGGELTTTFDIYCVFRYLPEKHQLDEVQWLNKDGRVSLTLCVSLFLPSRVSSGSLASGPSSYEVASPASQELYVFDLNGTHQFTISLVTGDYRYNFSYRLVCVEMNR